MDIEATTPPTPPAAEPAPEHPIAAEQHFAPDQDDKRQAKLDKIKAKIEKSEADERKKKLEAQEGKPPVIEKEPAKKPPTPAPKVEKVEPKPAEPKEKAAATPPSAPPPAREEPDATSLAALSRKEAEWRRERESAKAEREKERQAWEAEKAKWKEESELLAIARRDPVAFVQKVGGMDPVDLAQRFWGVSLGDAAPPELRAKLAASDSERDMRRQLAELKAQQEELRAEVERKEKQAETDRRIGAYGNEIADHLDKLGDDAKHVRAVVKKIGRQAAAERLVRAALSLHAEDPEADLSPAAMARSWEEGIVRDLAPFLEGGLYSMVTGAPSAREAQPAASTQGSHPDAQTLNGRTGASPTPVRKAGLTREEKLRSIRHRFGQ